MKGALSSLRYFTSHAFFYKQHFYKQCQSEIGKKKKKIKQKLMNILRLNFWQTYLRNMFDWINEIMWLIIMKMKMATAK